MIRKKREQLEQFVIEQTLGPGINQYRYVDLQNIKLLSKNILLERPIDYSNELINIVPAGVYSTGILFPVDKSRSVDNGLASPHDKESVLNENEVTPTHKESDESTVEEEAIQIDQMYPNTMGFTFCLDDSIRTSNDFVINVQARYYTKVGTQEKDSDIQFGVLCECDVDRFVAFLKKVKLDVLITPIQKGKNYILTIQKLKPDQIKEIQLSLRNFGISEVGRISNRLTEFNFTFHGASVSALKQSCYYELKNKTTNQDQRKKLYLASQEIEEFENYISHIDDLLAINGEGYGLWKSNPVDLSIQLSDFIASSFEGRKIFSYKEHERLRNIFEYKLGDERASLSLNIQLSSDSRKFNNKIFVKAQLVNTSSPFKKDPEDSRYYSTFNEIVNQRAFFGVKLSVSDKHLVSYNEVDLTKVKANYNEDDVTKFVYRQFEDYAIGHGCSVKWEKHNDNIKIETEYLPICDTPDVEPIPRSKEQLGAVGNHFEPNPFLESTKALEFKWLSIFSKTTDDEVIDGLNEFIDSYDDWIASKRTKYRSKSDTFKAIAFQELDKCQSDKDRMSKNVKSFLHGKDNSINLKSFRLMNAAMFMQLWHSVKVKNDEIGLILDNPEFEVFDSKFYMGADDRLFDKTTSASWRPFQLAFILLNLDGIYKGLDDPKWQKRNEFVDLVWFPTGGGKTEAYLGIIALTIINRRIKYKERGGGTAALMRYTLRLLTLQQFQRATLVIMALELIRRWDVQALGQEPIFIGLWVGDNSLPNKMASSDVDDKNNLVYEFRKLSEGGRSKIPYESCPWCKSKLNPSTEVENDAKNTFHFNRLHLRCSNSKCNFWFSRPSRARKDQGPIPVSLCDEEIYQHPPALLFGTVDKFAQLAHKVSNDNKQRNRDSRRIFGKGNWESGKPQDGYFTPDLIIQDELHLLLGPLGSSVALFESAIDQLCTSEDGIRPKVISSTATTRNTDLQIMALFDRKVNLFPKPGVECDDSFFAFYKRLYRDNQGKNEEYLSKRRYMGILPTGRTQIWMQMRLAAVLMTHRTLFELQELKSNNPLMSDTYAEFEKAMDYYHTVISYFNSLKEVGKTESQIHTYILKEIRRVFNRVIRPSKLMHSLYTYSIRKGELTGRLSGEEVKNELEKVQTKWKPQDRFAQLINEDVRIGSSPPDFVVATNMISVGIDVSRFNTIIMNSMPRNIAEYIQASSRVARDSYGLVLTIHHPFRARDISHYEKFIEFHEKMYSYVEPISITPFTKKAVERYLGLYLATMIRHTTEYTNRGSAINIRQLSDKELNKLVDNLSIYFEKRRIHLENFQVDEIVKNLLKQSNVKIIRDWIGEAVSEWYLLANNTFVENNTLVFKDKKKVNPPALAQEQLYVDIEEYEGNIHSHKWQVPMSLRVIEPEAALKIKLK